MAKTAQNSGGPDWKTCFRRGMRLVCPECGVSPIFVPWRKVRSIFDWFTPLDGCSRCGYAYEREQGYFLLAVWGVNYGVVAGLGLIAGLLIQRAYHPPLWSPMWLWLLPMPILSLLFARHAKALFLAMDHYFDPHAAPANEPVRDDHENPSHS